jgi:5-formyltetrahydrofolate cyclo-ligase
MDSKSDLRKKAKCIRKSLSIAEKSKIAIEKIRENTLYISAKNVLIYYPLRYELNLLALLDDEKNFYLPRVCGENLQICPFKKGDKLVTSSFNICEPCSNSINPRNLDLVVVPALMADKSGFRLGYGGGFYDRFLVKNNTVKTILPIAKELIVEELPHEEFDIKIDEIIPV